MGFNRIDRLANRTKERQNAEPIDGSDAFLWHAWCGTPVAPSLARINSTLGKTMRSLLFVIAVAFIFGGFLAIWNPRVVFVAHAPTRYTRGATEIVSKDRSVLYGFISVGIGSIALIGALTFNTWYSSDRGD